MKKGDPAFYIGTGFMRVILTERVSRDIYFPPHIQAGGMQDRPGRIHSEIKRATQKERYGEVPA